MFRPGTRAARRPHSSCGQSVSISRSVPRRVVASTAGASGTPSRPSVARAARGSPTRKPCKLASQGPADGGRASVPDDCLRTETRAAAANGLAPRASPSRSAWATTSAHSSASAAPAPATPSVVWPPNAMLTAALLLTRRDRWWIVLAAALPAHLAVQLQTEWPLPLIGLAVLHQLLRSADRRGRLPPVERRNTAIRYVQPAAGVLPRCGLAAPLISSFADAAVVNGFLGEPYWQVWRFRLFATSWRS